MKDNKIESVFDEYLSGASLPKVSLDDAKNLIEEKKRNDKRKKKMWLSFASLACALVVVISTYFIVDSLTVKYYDIASLKQTNVTFAELKEDDKYSKYVKPFEVVEDAANANIDYFIYYDGDNANLLKLEINAITGEGAERATIYIELTDNKYTCESFKNYYELNEKSKISNIDFKYNTEQVAGEWVSSAYFEYLDVKYFIDIESPNGGGNVADNNNQQVNYALKKYLEVIFQK